jgi:hypothetical protein
MRVLVVTAMYPTPEKPASGTFVKEQVDSLREAGVDVDVFAFDGKGSARNYLKAGMTLRRILSEKPYDLIHAHYGLTGGAALMQTRCPVVITFHGSDLLGEVGLQYKYTLAGKAKTIISRGAAVGASERIVVADFFEGKTLAQVCGDDPDGCRPVPVQAASDRRSQSAAWLHAQSTVGAVCRSSP